MSKDEVLKAYINQQVDSLDRALATFNHTYTKAKHIGIKERYDFDELDVFESLTSKFARISDVFTQKLLKSLIHILREDAHFFIDRANFAEKLGLIESVAQLIKIRDLRNDIAHEYLITDISNLFEDILSYSQVLLDMIENTKVFVANLFKEDGSSSL